MDIDFRSASLNRAHFRDARLSYAELQARLPHRSRLRGAPLQGADFRGVKLRQVDIDRAPLSKEQKRQIPVVVPATFSGRGPQAPGRQ